MSGPVRVALALGAGGARGYAHIGAIQVLRERGADIVGIAGSSMGALVGALHAAGRLDDYTEWVEGVSQLDVVRMLDPTFGGSGAIRAEKVLLRVRQLLGDTRIEDLPIPFTAVATDLATRREVWFQRGPVHVAVRASIAIPGVFTPVMLNGRLLVDGAITDPVPVAPTVGVGADLTIGISLSGDRRDDRDGPPATIDAEPRPFDEWAERFRRGASFLMERDIVRSLLQRFHRDERGDEDEHGHVHRRVMPAIDHDADELGVVPADLSKYEVMSQSLEAMQHLVSRFRMAAHPPDLLVSIPKDACRTFDFHRATELIAVGRELTTAALDGAGLLPVTPAARAVSAPLVAIRATDVVATDVRAAGDR